MQLGAHIVIKGVVQGVGFRYFAYRQASKLALIGYVRNLYSGEVEIEVFGERSALEEFIKEIKVGPRSAHVSDMRVEWKEYESKNNGFEIR